jgi:transposase
MQKAESLFSNQSGAQIDLVGLKLMLDKEQERSKHLEEEVARLYEIIQEFKRHRFGPRRERWESEEQACLFNEAEVASQKLENDESEEDVKVKGFVRKRGKRKPLPQNLPREVIVIDLPEEEKVTEEGTPLRVIGKEVSEKLFYEPATIKVLEYHRLRYGIDSGDTGKIAAPVPSIIPKGIVTPSLLAQIVTSKYADGLPLYRQEEMFGRLDIDLSRSSMGRWIIQAAEACQPIWNLLEERLMSSPYVSCDETWTQVLKENGRKAENHSWMWVRSTPTAEKKIVLFDYDPHRSGEVAKRLFADFVGWLQVDGYSSYNILEKQAGCDRIGCNMHGRRKFHAAWKTGAKNGQSLAAQGLKFYKRIYDLEEELKGIPWTERFALREEKVRPIWNEFKEWADLNYPKVPPKSKIGEAFHYFINEYSYLAGYLKDGQLEPDNGFVERAIKYFAIGRNNWLFSDTEDGARASGLFYSLVVTIKINGGNPYQALKSLFTEIPKAHTVEQYDQLVDLILSPASAL